jgi:hypothetical protein
MRDYQAAQNLEHVEFAEDEAMIRTTLITLVENNAPLNIDPQKEPERFSAYREMFFKICRRPGFGNERSMKWMAWGTHAGFTII